MCVMCDNCLGCNEPLTGECVPGPWGVWHKPCYDSFFQPLFAATARAFDAAFPANREYWERPAQEDSGRALTDWPLAGAVPALL